MVLKPKPRALNILCELYLWLTPPTHLISLAVYKIGRSRWKREGERPVVFWCCRMTPACSAGELALSCGLFVKQSLRFAHTTDFSGSFYEWTHCLGEIICEAFRGLLLPTVWLPALCSGQRLLLSLSLPFPLCFLPLESTCSQTSLKGQRDSCSLRTEGKNCITFTTEKRKLQSTDSPCVGH